MNDFAFEGNQFTWEKGRGTCGWVREKLDRILVSEDWSELFEGVKACSFEVISSDHLPIAIWHIPIVYKKRIRSFKFENLWIRERQCRRSFKTHGKDLLGMTF